MFCCFKGCCFGMRGELGVDSKSSSYLENPRTLKIWVGEVLALNSNFRPSTQDASVQKGCGV